MTPVISISIGSYNRRDWLLRAIDALAASDLHSPIELCVVLDGCTDGSADAVRDRFARLPRHILPILIDHTRNAGVGQAHQSSLEATSAPIAAFIDDDCVPTPDFLPRLLSRFEAAGPTIVGVGGFIVPHTIDTLNRRYLGASDPHRPTEADFIGASFTTRLRLAIRPPRREGVRSVYALVGGAMAFRRDALLAVGGFATDIHFGGFETRLCEELRARFGDASLLADPAIVVAHDYHPDLRGTFRRALRAGAAIGRDFARRGGLPSLRPNPALIGAATTAGLLLSPAAALLGGLAATYTLYGRVARGRLLERLLYPLLLALEEGTKNAGFLHGLWTHRHEWRREVVR
jgi:GT2 family glycosyltransferase